MIADLHRKVHLRLRNLREMDELFIAEEDELERVYKRILQMEKNASVTGADVEMIARHEKAFGVVSDGRKSLADRKSVILALLRGSGTTTPAFIKNLCLSFENGDVEVIENADKPYHVLLKFISVYGVPPNLDDFLAVLKVLMPAHLVIDLAFRYLIWNEFDGYNKTWDQWDGLNLTWDELEVYHEG